MAESQKKAPNLYQRILAVSAEVKNVEKNLNVSTGKSSYKAVADYDVVLAVKAAEVKHGVIGIPVRQELIDTQIMEYKDSYGNTKTQFVDIVKMTVRFINTDDPTEFVEVESYGRGIDNGDKSFGKASTYARKYALLNAYKIATGEDPDQVGSEEGRFRKSSATAARQAVRQSAPAPAPAPAEPQAYQPLKDEDFQKLVMAYANGKKTKAGGDIRETWISVTHAGEKEIADFDRAVSEVKLAMGAAAAERIKADLR